MNLGLTGKVAVITGAAGGIGSATAYALACEGVKVALLDKNASGLDAVASNIHTVTHSSVGTATVNLTCADEVADTIERVLRPFDGHIDILINTAGVCPAFEPEQILTAQALDTWHTLYEENFYSTFLPILSVWPRMVHAGGGIILNTVSDLAHQPVPEMLPYSIAKASIEHLTYSLAAYLGQSNVRVAGVAPGPVRTAIWTCEGGLLDFYSRKYHLPPEEAVTKELQHRGMALPQLCTAEDVASLFVYLASDRATSITRTIINIHGGSHHSY